MNDHSKNQDIEFLRGIAVTFTFIQHLQFLFPWSLPFYQSLGQYAGFWSGVDLFFVISGFVITRSLYHVFEPSTLPTSRVSVLKKFWIKRVFRLLPNAWSCAIFTLIVAALMPASSQFPPLDAAIREAAAAFLNISNFFFAHCISTAQQHHFCSDSMILGHYWSLSLEEQFYLVLPLLILFFSRQRLLALLVILVIIQFSWNRPMFSYGWFFRSDGLMWGVIIALLSKLEFHKSIEPTFLKSIPLRYINLIGTLLLLAVIPAQLSGFGIGLIGPSTPYAVGTLALIAALLVHVAAFDKDYVLPNNRFKRLGIMIGTRSYSLYLIHVPCFYIVKELWILWLPASELTNLNVLILFLLGFALTFALAEVAFRFIEVPSRDKGRALAAKIQ